MQTMKSLVRRAMLWSDLMHHLTTLIQPATLATIANNRTGAKLACTIARFATTTYAPRAIVNEECSAVYIEILTIR
jgi:hypothetical protein